MFRTYYHHIRHNYPTWFTIIIILVTATIILLVSLFITRNTALLHTLGLRAAITRVHAAKEAIFWTYRAWRHADTAADLDPPRVYGFLQSVNRDTTVNITIIRDSQYQTERITLADLVITNPTRLAHLVAAHNHDNMEFAFYPPSVAYPYTVIWFNDEPFNLTLITEGIAKPDTTPPTNIVDRLFAIYYWKLFTR